MSNDLYKLAGRIERELSIHIRAFADFLGHFDTGVQI